jgi:hypothetical protein
LPASYTASSTDSPTARWSALFQCPGTKYSRRFSVITSSGRCRRIAAASSRRSTTPDSIAPSGWSRNSTVETPTTSAEARCSASRIGAHSSGDMVSIPASPRLTMR